MTVPDRGSDDLVQQVAEVIHAADCGCPDGPDDVNLRAARAVLARRDLIVPTRDVLDLAQQWWETVSEHRSTLDDCAAELRALAKETP